MVESSIESVTYDFFYSVATLFDGEYDHHQGVPSNERLLPNFQSHSVPDHTASFNSTNNLLSPEIDITQGMMLSGLTPTSEDLAMPGSDEYSGQDANC